MSKTKESPNLEVISSSNELKHQERRNVPRLNLSSEVFRLLPQGKLFPVHDISASGMSLGLMDPLDGEVFSVGMMIEGMINLKREKYPIKARVRYLRGSRVGCEFESLPHEAALKIAQFLDPVALGKELRPIPAPELDNLWYHGPSGTDLLFRRLIDGQYHRVILYVLDSYVQWDETDGLSTGETRISKEKGETRGVLRFETLLLEPDSSPHLEKLDIAKTVILSSNLPQDLKTWCQRKFTCLEM